MSDPLADMLALYERSGCEFHPLAACRGMDPAIWFPDDDQDQTQEAKRICRTCPVTVPCVEWGIQNADEFGIRGGVIASHRVEWRKKGWNAEKMVENEKILDKLPQSVV